MAASGPSSTHIALGRAVDADQQHMAAHFAVDAAFGVGGGVGRVHAPMLGRAPRGRCHAGAGWVLSQIGF